VQKAVRKAVAKSVAAVGSGRLSGRREGSELLVMKKTRGKASANEVHRLVKEEVEKP
jgi:Asp-tRNA(Asn)/Glu-tRNA(Gln) amidotransferase B subunit